MNTIIIPVVSVSGKSASPAYKYLRIVHVHQAARLLLDARMGAMVDADILELLDKEVGHRESSSASRFEC